MNFTKWDSLPGKSGLVRTVLLRSPVKMYFILREIFNWVGVIRGSSVQSPVRSVATQKLQRFAPVPFGYVSAASSPASSPPSACPSITK